MICARRLIDPDAVDMTLGFKLARAAIRLRQELRRACREAGLDVTPEQWALLNRLYLHDGLTQSELADQTLKDRPTVTRIVDALQRGGMLARRRDPDDRRCYRLHLTEAGRELRREVYPLTLALNERLVAGLADAEMEALADTLDRLSRNLG